MSDANPTPVSASRNADGINEKELACAIAQSEYEHEHGHHHSHDGADFYDYTQAVREYKKTFANKQQVIEQTPDPAVRDMSCACRSSASIRYSTALMPSSRNARSASRASAVRIASWVRAR